MANLPKDESSNLLDLLSPGVSDRLRKIASATGIPVMLLMESVLIQFVLKNWHCKKEKPRFKPNDNVLNIEDLLSVVP